METFLAPGEHAEDPLSFRVICLVQCRSNLLLLIFSSLDGQWHVLTYDQWGVCATLASFVKSEPGLSSRQFVHGCFYWRLHKRCELLVLNLRAMEFSAIKSRQRSDSFVVVEAAKGMLGMLTKGYGNDRCCLQYSILTNNQWHFEKVIPLPVKYVSLVGVAGGYLLVYAMYDASSQEKMKFGFFSVNLKTLQVELFAALGTHSPRRLYAGFPPSLCAPTI
uniref:F-box protein n=1 Tax=Hordeum vulgare subsp. vulgare TaxID=112509 RepID=A0A287RLD0_HORVV